MTYDRNHTNLYTSFWLYSYNNLETLGFFLLRPGFALQPTSKNAVSKTHHGPFPLPQPYMLYNIRLTGR